MFIYENIALSMYENIKLVRIRSSLLDCNISRHKLSLTAALNSSRYFTVRIITGKEIIRIEVHRNCASNRHKIGFATSFELAKFAQEVV